MPALHNSWEYEGHQEKAADAADTMQQSLALSPSARAHRSIGLYYLKQCRYALALKHLKISERGRVRDAIRSAEHGLRMEKLAILRLQPGYALHRSFGIHVSGHSLWVALSTTSIEKEAAGHPNRVRILVLEDRADRAQVVWQSPVLPDIQERGFTELDLWPLRMTGSKNPELLFLGNCSGGSANPGIAMVYRWNGKRFRKVLDCDSPEQPLWVEDLKHDGRYQVRAVQLVGTEMSHAEQVRWPLVYAWN